MPGRLSHQEHGGCHAPEEDRREARMSPSPSNRTIMPATEIRRCATDSSFGPIGGGPLPLPLPQPPSHNEPFRDPSRRPLAFSQCVQNTVLEAVRNHIPEP